jgi:acyl-CoA thioesterase I
LPAHGKNEFGPLFWTTCVLSLVVVLFAACKRDGVSPGVARGTVEMKAGPIVYVALGDSTGSGVGARNGGYVARLFNRVLEHRPNSELANLCVSGATTGDLLRGQLQPGIQKSPDVVTVGIGINDIGHGLTLDQFTKNYDEILSTLKENTDAEIVVTNIPDVSTAPRIPASLRAEYQRQIEQFNERLEEIARRHEVIVFDIFTITRRELPSHPEYFSSDGFHPSDAGYELWAQEMWPTIAEVIGAG